jgi:hypothetical protein
MKALSVTFLILMAVCATSWAQGNNPGCKLFVHDSDRVCTVATDCSSLTGCTSTTFTPSCGGKYTLAAWVHCSAGQCAHCAACVSIWTTTPSVYVGGCDNTDVCGAETCRKSCSIDLTANTSYTMFVCLITCPPEVSCLGCGESCTAHGCLTNGTPCPIN